MDRREGGTTRDIAYAERGHGGVRREELGKEFVERLSFTRCIRLGDVIRGRNYWRGQVGTWGRVSVLSALSAHPCVSACLLPIRGFNC